MEVDVGRPATTFEHQLASKDMILASMAARSRPGSKQARVLPMLGREEGATIAAIMRDPLAAALGPRLLCWDSAQEARPQGSSWRKRPPSELRGEVQRIDAEVSHETSRLSHRSRRGCRVAPPCHRPEPVEGLSRR